MNNKLVLFGIISFFILTSLSLTPLSFGYNIDTKERSEGTLLAGDNLGKNNYNSDVSDELQGVTIYNDEFTEGYTLISYTSRTVVLIDMNGNVVRSWDLNPFPARLFPGGRIMGGEGYYDWLMPFSESTNLTQFDWNGNMVWSFADWDDAGTGINMSRQHHDYQYEGYPADYYAPGLEFDPNGKTLILSHLNIINRSMSRKPLWDDVIYEVDWNGSLTGFEWHASDHFDEMGFNWKEKIGIFLFPGRRDPLYPFGNGDWFHINSISRLGDNKWYEEYNDSRFHPENILFGSRYSNIIGIIDRETRKIVWKVGPDFSKNTLEGQNLDPLIGHHHAHMIPKGLKGEGNILVFDNGMLGGIGLRGTSNKARGWSRVVEFNPINLSIEWEYSNIVGNNKIEWKINWYIPRKGPGHHFYSWFISSAQRLPNGNTLIAEGDNGRAFEVNYETKEIVWEFLSPSRNHNIYRAYRIPPEWVPDNPANYPFWEDDSYS
jgi:hypothetical protein